MTCVWLARGASRAEYFSAAEQLTMVKYTTTTPLLETAHGSTHAMNASCMPHTLPTSTCCQRHPILHFDHIACHTFLHATMVHVFWALHCLLHHTDPHLRQPVHQTRLTCMHFMLNHALIFPSAPKARGECRKLYADEKAKLLARRRTQEQASSITAQAIKSKPGVSCI